MLTILFNDGTIERATFSRVEELAREMNESEHGFAIDLERKEVFLVERGNIHTYYPA